MRMADLMTEELVILSLGAKTKEAVIDELIAALSDEGHVKDVAALKESIIAREVLDSTGFGQGVAIPHAVTAAVKSLQLVYGYSEVGLDYESLDDQMAHWFFMIVTPPEQRELQIEMLSHLAACIGEPDFRSNLAAAITPNQAIEVIAMQEDALYKPPFADKQQIDMEDSTNSDVTMEQMGMAILDPITGNRPTYGRSKRTAVGVWGKFYYHLACGVSHVLPLVIGGGLLLILSLMLGIDVTDPSANSSWLAVMLAQIGGGIALSLIVPVLAAYISVSIADRPGFAPGIVGGMIAQTSGCGLLGGLAAGWLAGYVVTALTELIRIIPIQLEKVKWLLLLPLCSIAITGILMYVFVVEPIAWLNRGLGHLLQLIGIRGM